jgi:hypothetical protein
MTTAAWPGSLRVVDVMHHVLSYLSMAECLGHRCVSPTACNFIDDQYFALLETIHMDARRLTGVSATRTPTHTHTHTDPILEHIARRSPKMKTLVLDNAEHVNQTTMRMLADRWPLLTSVSLGYVFAIRSCDRDFVSALSGALRVDADALTAIGHVRHLHVESPMDLFGVCVCVAVHWFGCLQASNRQRSRGWNRSRWRTIAPLPRISSPTLAPSSR